MANYTIELRHVVEGRNIFPHAYPFYDEKERPKFEQAFIRHFYFREIGADTIDKFLFFLDEKMNTVFPYYNELFKTAQMEYSVLDNYNITERTTMKRENVGRSSGETYTVGQTFDEQNTETTEDRTAEKTDTGKSTSETVQNEVGTSETNRNGTSTTERSETVDATGTKDTTVTNDLTKTTHEEENASQEDIKKFLDTPQGSVDLSDSKYLTTLNHDTADRHNERDGSTSDTGTVTTDEDTTTHTETDGNSTTTDVEKITGETGRDLTENGEVNTENTANAKENATGKVEFTGQQRTTNDGAIKSRSEGETKETVEFTRKGNIGIDTDADMIQKHIKLQQILKKIELMFFDECEDLFMQVY